MKIKGAIFDMDGTLLDSLGFWNIAWSKVGEKYLGDPSFYPTEEEDKAVRTMFMQEAMDYIYGIYGFGSSSAELYNELNELIDDFYLNTAKLKNGACELLDYLKNSNKKICIASATERPFIEKVAKNLGISNYFDKIFSCADIGKSKDVPDIYNNAAEFMGYSADDICVFEDSALAISTAKKAGFKTVGIYDKYNYGQDIIRKNADIYIDENESFKKIIGIIK